MKNKDQLDIHIERVWNKMFLNSTYGAMADPDILNKIANIKLLKERSEKIKKILNEE
jgi:hypothetical protein